MSHNYEYFVETEVSPAHFEEMIEFMMRNFLKPQSDNFKNYQKSVFGRTYKLSFDGIKTENNIKIHVEIIFQNPLKISLIFDQETPLEVINELREDILTMIQFYEEYLHQSTLYFAWVEGEDIIPESPPTSRKKMGDWLFGSSLLLVYVLFFGVNIILFFFIGFYAVIIILLFQLLIILFSDKIYLMRSNWQITPQNPYLHIIEYQLPLDDFKEFQQKFGKNMVIKMKKEIYQKSLAQGNPPTCEIGNQILETYGFQCYPENSRSKTLNVYNIVKKAAESFGLPTPRIVISNTMIPNAAATGPSPKRGLVLLTTGLLVQLTEEEILSVVGHEMGHLAGRDPLILFSIISIEFLLRFTLLLPLVLLSPLLYILFMMGFIYFIAKFFEARADLLSAMKIGKPHVLAEALRKIGFQRLKLERSAATRVPGWVNWDPHPPLYFRIDRLEQLKSPLDIEDPLIQSAKDVFNGFKRALGFR